jgi:endonuclease YncB( thermonuclease family)
VAGGAFRAFHIAVPWSAGWGGGHGGSVEYSHEGLILTILIVLAIVGAGLWLNRRERRATPTPNPHRRHGMRRTWPKRQMRWRLPWWLQKQINIAVVLICVAGLIAAESLVSGVDFDNIVALAWSNEQRPTVVRPNVGNGSNVIRVGPPTSTGRAVIVDGDTFSLAGEKIRLVGIDAPESFNSRCERELVLGLKAKQRLRQLLDEGSIELDRDGKDRYGRTLARVLVEGSDIGAVMVHEGFALRYQPSAAAKEARLKKWCGPDARLGDTWSGG